MPSRYTAASLHFGGLMPSGVAVPMRKLALLALCCLTLSAHGQPPASPQPTVRYQFGDNARWADPALDDSAWPVAQDGLVPSRSRDTDRFLWVRIRVRVPGNLNGPVALHLDGLGALPMTWQVFVNGQPLGRQGAFPPRADPADPPVSPVITLPSSLAPQDSVALVALREWHAPTFAQSGVPSHPTAVIDEARVLNLRVSAVSAEALLANGPEYALSALLALAGIGLLFFWRSSSGREYLWAAIMLLSPLATAILSSGPVTARLSFHTQTWAVALVYIAGLIAEIEFMWTLFRLRARWLRILWHATWIAFILGGFGEAYFFESPAVLHLCRIVIVTGIAAFDCILFPVCVREMFRRGGNRAIAAAQSLMEVIIALGVLGYSVQFTLGPLPLDLWQLTLTLVDLAIAAMLFRRAWKAWTAIAQKLEVERRTAQELEIAKQVQARLFPQTVPAIIGLDYAGVCLQARHVGGDYYDFLALGQERLGLLIGDVAGKGIAAALLMANLQANLRSQFVLAREQPHVLLRSVNRLFYQNTAENAYATFFFAEYDSPARRLRYANCGHLPTLLLRHDGTLERLEPTGTVLGLFPEWDSPTLECQIFPGDMLALYTDGVTESFNEMEEEFGEERLVEALRRHREQPAEAMVASIVEDIQRFSAAEQHDDITLIVAKFNGYPPLH